MGFFTALYGAAAYLVFLATFLYAIGFTGNWLVPKSLDGGLPPGAAGEPVVISIVLNLLLLGVFAVQHSVMARPAFKRWWTRIVAPAAERSTYVLLASCALILVFALWRPIGPLVWNLDGHAAGTALTALCALGWALVLASTFQIDHFELFGLKQPFFALLRRALPVPVFRTPLFYRHVRHPIYLGFILAFWSAPVMSVGHLLFAATTTAYIFVGIWFEERDLVAHFGQRYRDYRRQVGMLLPKFGRRDADAARKVERSTPRSGA